MIHAKEDGRPQKGWWAPGNYMNTCVHCKERFFGDKRAVECADCAYKDLNHIVISVPDTSNNIVLWVCTKCWPGTNEVLMLGDLRVPSTCEMCGTVVTVQEINPIWRSWLVAVLRRHWEEHKV